jgi:hypothetical protein
MQPGAGGLVPNAPEASGADTRRSPWRQPKTTKEANYS